MAETKEESVKNIRKSITPRSGSLTGERLKESTAANVAIADNITKMTSKFEKLSESQRKFFESLIAEVKKVPESTQEFKKQQQVLYEKLIKTSEILKKELEKETDTNKKKEISEVIDQLESRKKDIKAELPRKPETIKERLAQRHFRGDPNEVAEKGYFGTMFSQAKRELFGEPKIQQEDKDFAEQLTAGVKEFPKKAKVENLKKPSTKEKTKDNLKGVSTLEKKFSALLSEVTIIRKLVEGSLKYNPKLKGSPYYQEDAEGKKRAVSKKMAATAGTGLYTKDELGKKLGLTKTEIKKTDIKTLEEQAAKDRLIDLEEPEQTEEPREEEKQEEKKKVEEVEKPRKPETWKEKLAYKNFKGNPDEVKKKGYFGALFSQTKREIGGLFGKKSGDLGKEENTQNEKIEPISSDDKDTTPENKKDKKENTLSENIKKIAENSDKIVDILSKDINENLEKSTSIDTNPTDEQRFKTSASDTNTEKEAFATTEPKSSKASLSDMMPNGIMNKLKGARSVLSKGLKGAGRLAKGAGRLGTVMTGSVAGASGAAVAGTVVGGLATGMAIGDKFNTSIEDGGSGNLKDWWRNTKLGGLRKQSIAEKENERVSKNNADEIAKKKGFASFEEMKEHNKKLRAVEKTKTNVAAAIETEQQNQQQNQQQPTTNVVNNYNNAPAPEGRKKEIDPPILPVRTSDTSFIRYQDKRMTRIL